MFSGFPISRPLAPLFVLFYVILCTAATSLSLSLSLIIIYNSVALPLDGQQITYRCLSVYCARELPLFPLAHFSFIARLSTLFS